MRKGIVTGCVGAVSFAAGFILGGKVLVNLINDYKKRMKRNFSNMTLFSDWLDYLYSGNSIEQYFHNHGYKKVLIYGNGYIGKRLSQALEKTDIEVAAIMDKAASSEDGSDIIGTDSKMPDVDCVVVTPTFFYDEIYNMLREKTDVPIISMQSVVER